MSAIFNAIPVEDGNGDPRIVYETWERGSFFGLVAERRFQLDTGEVVEVLCDNVFVIAATGEMLKGR